MKKLTVVFLFFVCCTAHAQRYNLDNTKWVDDKLQSLQFFNGNVFLGHIEGGKFKTDKDTLIIVSASVNPKTSDTIRQTSKYLISDYDQTAMTLTLYVEGFDKERGRMIGSRADWSYHFKNLKYAVDPTLKFNRLHFNSTTCYGSCPVLSIEIDNKGDYFLEGGKYSDPYKGFYKGKLSPNQLDSLNYLLQRSQIRKMKDWRDTEFNIDTPNYTLFVDYGDDSLSIKTSIFSIHLRDLTDFLVESYKKITLVPDTDKHVFENN